MGRSTRMQRHLDAEIDEALSTAALVADDSALRDRAFGQVVDLLVERAFCSLRADYLAGAFDADLYRCEVRALDSACRRAGLLRRRG